MIFKLNSEGFIHNWDEATLEDAMIKAIELARTAYIFETRRIIKRMPKIVVLKYKN